MRGGERGEGGKEGEGKGHTILVFPSRLEEEGGRGGEEAGSKAPLCTIFFPCRSELLRGGKVPLLSFLF